MRDCNIKIILASSFVFSLTSWQKTCKTFLNWRNFQVGNKIKLIKKSYLENFLPAQKIKSPLGIAVTDDKKPWTRKRTARSNCSNRVLKPFTSTWQKCNDTFTKVSFLWRIISIFSRLYQNTNWFYLAIINNTVHFVFLCNTWHNFEQIYESLISVETIRTTWMLIFFSYLTKR